MVVAAAVGAGTSVKRAKHAPFYFLTTGGDVHFPSCLVRFF